MSADVQYTPRMSAKSSAPEYVHKDNYKGANGHSRHWKQIKVCYLAYQRRICKVEIEYGFEKQPQQQTGLAGRS